ncbi:MAG: DUF1203 domain-containing protein [Cohaesibacteraceae bacterium]|nr:DUF1203 domain-containing protein [Cohaesibacteraceae bacterium]
MSVTSMDYKVTGLSAEPFVHLYGLSETELAAQGVTRMIATEPDSFPDRIEMRDGEIGESFLLLNHEYQTGDSPYRARHAIFVREGATDQFECLNAIPDVMHKRMIALRAFDINHLMVDAEIAQGDAIEIEVQRMLANADVAYIQAHNARRGCYSGRIERA